MADNPIIPVIFETFIPPQVLGDQVIPYRLQEEPYLRQQMMQKIEKGIQQFGSIERFMEAFLSELEEKRSAAEYAVRSFQMRRLQMEFLERHYKENCTPKVEGLDI